MVRNPTYKEDLQNLNKDEAEQYPKDAPSVRTIDAKDTMESTIYPDSLTTNYTLLRCSKITFITLQAAQSFFDKRRRVAAEANLPWISETPIYRTGAWWCKRIVERKP